MSLMNKKLKNLIMNDWKEILKDEFDREYFINLENFVNFEYQNYKVYPEYQNIFKALELTSFQNTKVVIIGQDPYHNPKEAHGLAFSTVLNKYPASLRNIFKELETDLGIKKVTGDLTSWAQQGVLLLNTVLTVRENQPNSHKKCGWIEFTNQIISKLNQKNDAIIFVLWGDNAIAKKSLITNPNHYIITSPHPSPLAAYRGFFGSKPFSKVNEILLKNNKEVIKW